MSEQIEVGDRVKILLDAKFWNSQGWCPGTVVRVDPYSAHRQFYWVELDLAVRAVTGGTTNLVSVLNPSHIVKE